MPHELQPKIEMFNEKKLIGKRLSMTFGNDKTFELWRSFMPRRKEIGGNLSADLISMQVYSPLFNFNQFNLDSPFEKWATVEVSDFSSVPDEMKTFVLPSGLYAVFHYKGLNTDTSIFNYIFKMWLPSSDYSLDDRPHFQILGMKYKNNDPDSEEEICIPIAPRKV